MFNVFKKSKDLASVTYGTNIILNIFFLIYSVVCIFPLVLVLAVSLTSEIELVRTGYGIFPKEISTVAYDYLFANGKKIISAYGYTFFTVIVGTSVGLLLTASFAYPLSRKDFKFREKFALYVTFTMLFNCGTVPLYILYSQIIPIKNTILALVFPGMINGFSIMLMRTYFRNNIPDSVVESAEIDGASLFRIFFAMVIPLSKPVIATVGLFTAMGYWNDYFRNLLYIFDERIMNLQYLLFRIQNQISVINTNPELSMRLGGTIPAESSRMAMVIITIGPIIFLYPFLQKYFVKGLTIGAVKG